MGLPTTPAIALNPLSHDKTTGADRVCVVRRACSQDVSTLLKMIRGLATYEKLETSHNLSPLTLSMALFGPEPQAYALLAEVKGEAAGMAIYFYRFSSFLGASHLFLDNLFVDDRFRGAGVGKTLFKVLSQTALAANCPEIHWRVLGCNEPSIKFYEKLGAQLQQGWDYYSLKEACMLALLVETDPEKL